MDSTDHIIFLVGGITLGLLQGYSAWKASQNAKTLADIHVLTNGTMTQQKKVLAEVTAAKAYLTKDPMDIKAAEDALKDFLQQDATTASLDKKNP